MVRSALFVSVFWLALLIDLASGLSARATAQTGDQAEFLSSLDWPDAPPGLSGLVIAPDGASLRAVADQGQLVAVELLRDPGGLLTGIGPASVYPLRPPPRATWPDTWLYSDAEGLAELPDGRLAVSYEGLHRVSLHNADGSFALWLEVPDAFARLPINSGLEGLAVREDGVLLAIPEVWPDRPRPIFAFDGTAWQIMGTWPDASSQAERFRPVGLDLDETGRLYVLERALRLPVGFASRIRRYDPQSGDPPELLLQTPVGRHGNLEGISLWRRADGALIASMVADNNGHSWLRGGLVEYRLPD